MTIYYRASLLFFSLMLVLCSTSKNAIVYADLAAVNTFQQSIESYLLPADHPLQECIPYLFVHPRMFKSPENFRKAGFKVKLGHHNLMVGGHRFISSYLFKKFTNNQSQSMQLANFIKRIEGAEALRRCIKKHHFKHLVVPYKWLYQLPQRFSGSPEITSYLLIVENMSICHSEENLEQYYYMDREVLTELCTVIHEVGGCDAVPRNIPFTKWGKIAFIDTEHVGRMKNYFIDLLVPNLNPELQAYAIALWEKLEEEKAIYRSEFKN